MRILATRGHCLDPVAPTDKGASAPPAKGASGFRNIVSCSPNLPGPRGAPPLPPGSRGAPSLPPGSRGAPPLPPGPQGGAASSAPPAQVKLEPGAKGEGKIIAVIDLLDSDDDVAAQAPASKTTTHDGETDWQW